MALLRPFRAVRPAREAAAAVSSVPYDVVSTDEARALASGNPLSFLHVTRSEIDLPSGTDPYSPAVYAKARENFTALRQNAPMLDEDEPSLYFYRLRMGGHEQTGMAGCFSLDEYDRDLIKKHERTRRDKEDDRTRHMIELRAQTGVVFLTYRTSEAIERLCRVVTADAPVYDFRAADGVHHTVWTVPRRESTVLVDAFRAVPALYIADGHHRAASAARARNELRDQGNVGDADSFIAVAFPDDQVKILPYNRVVKDLAGRTPAQFLSALRQRLPVREGAATPSGKGEASMYLDGRWYAIDLSRAGRADGSRAQSLDVALLEREILGPLLEIADIRTDKRIDFVGGARGTSALESAVASGQAAVAFSMHPVTLDDLMTISDEGGIMPPKSTWFEPKLRDGLLVHAI
ncbi:MAG TPA: DUF1015 family protein [Vicinamibacterales bacterium]|nr:DUF1015 family protein [Vicinamibacterales bacterium]